MPTFILSGGRMEIKSDSHFPYVGCHLGNIKCSSAQIYLVDR